MIDRKGQIDDHRADDAQGEPIERQNEGGGGENGEVDGELRPARAPSKPVLKIERQHVDAAEPGAVAKENQQAGAGQHAADDAGVERGDLFKAHPLALKPREGRDEADRDEGAQREGPAHAQDRQRVKGQVEQRKGRPERPARGVGEQQAHA